MFKQTILFSLFLAAFHCCSCTVGVAGLRLASKASLVVPAQVVDKADLAQEVILSKARVVQRVTEVEPVNARQLRSTSIDVKPQSTTGLTKAEKRMLPKVIAGFFLLGLVIAIIVIGSIAGNDSSPVVQDNNLTTGGEDVVDSTPATTTTDYGTITTDSRGLSAGDKVYRN